MKDQSVMRPVRPARFLGGALLASILLGCCLSGSAFADVSITVDELGNGTLNGPGGLLALPASAAADPGPGGLASVLTYGLLNPPDLVFGDVQLVSGGVVTDVIRFVAAGTGNPNYAASLLFYSQPDANSHLVNTPTPPSAYYPNVISVPFGSVYTPGPGQPGYVSVITTHYTFNSVQCAYSLTPGSASFPAAGGNGSFTVTTQAGCPIAPATSSSFLAFMVSGNTVNYTVASFAGTTGRSGTITVSGQTFTVNQSSVCSYSLTPTSASFLAAGGSGSFVVIVASGCPITPTTTSNFLTFAVSGASVNYTVAALVGTTGRSGTIMVSDQTFTVNQSAPPPSITIKPQRLSFTSDTVTPPPSQTVSIEGGDGTFFDIFVDVPWITVTRNSSSFPAVLTVSVSPSKLSPGNYNGTITLKHGGFTDPIFVTYTVTPLPAIFALPTQLTFNYVIGGPAPASQQLTIYSTSAIAFQVAGGGFVSVSPGSGTTTQVVAVTVDPSKLAVGSYPGSVTVTANGVSNSPLAVPVTLNVTSLGPQFTALGVVNAASFQPGPFAPGSLISLFGTALANGIAMTAGPGFPLSLGGDSMTIDGIPAPLGYVSPGQINAQIPFEVGVGTKTLSLTTNNVTVSVQIIIVPGAPGVFLAGGGRGAILNQDLTLNGPGNAAIVGSTVVVFFTGQGLVKPPVATGAPAPLTPLSFTNATTTAMIGTMPAVVSFSGLAPGFVGLGQANVMVPGLTTNDYPLVLFVNGQMSNAGMVSVKTP